MKARFAWTLVALALASCGKNQTHTVLPPAQFDHEPSLYVDVRLPYWTINGYCREHADFTSTHERIEGCAIAGSPGHRPIRVVPLSGPEISDAEIMAIIRHENAHLNGWPANHPGGHF